MMNRQDMAALGVSDGETVTLVGAYDGEGGDNADKRVGSLRVVAYNIPRGCIAGYFPELNLLIPIAHHALESHVLAAKSVPVRVEVAR
jgi:anaerobic selenocysteine-containing dehydrogenase